MGSEQFRSRPGRKIRARSSRPWFCSASGGSWSIDKVEVGSSHTGAVRFLFADGSVRFSLEPIDDTMSGTTGVMLAIAESVDGTGVDEIFS